MKDRYLIPFKANLQKIYALFLAEFKTWRSYRMQYIFYFIDTLVGALAYSYLGNIVAQSGSLTRYPNMSFLAYLVIGISFYIYLDQSLNAATRIIDPWTLEHQLITPVSLHILLFGSSLWAYILNTITIGVYLGVGISLFSLRFNVNIVSTVLIIFLSLLVMWGFGMAAAGFEIVTKRWNPITWTLSVLALLVGGVFFPPEILPAPLQAISKIVPHYYILDLIRRSLVSGSTVTELLPDLVNLAILCLIVFPAGYVCLKKGIDKARKDGTLGHF
jgi:ABC-2 type transport system permease protein